MTCPDCIKLQQQIEHLEDTRRHFPKARVEPCPISLDEFLEVMFDAALKLALAKTDSKANAARVLGLKRTTLSEILKRRVKRGVS